MKQNNRVKHVLSVSFCASYKQLSFTPEIVIVDLANSELLLSLQLVVNLLQSVICKILLNLVSFLQ